MNNSLSNITGLHEGWTKVMQLEYGNECRFAVRSISLLYFKQAIAAKQPDNIQTETMQPMWCNPNIWQYLFSTTGLHEGWGKKMQLEYGNECRCAPSHSFIFKQAVTTKQLSSMQIVSNCDNATHVVQPKHSH